MLRLSAFMVEESSWCPSVQCAGVIPSRAGTLVELSTFRMLAENTAMAGKWSSISAIYRSTMETQIKIDMIQIYIVNRSTQKVETMFTCHECEKKDTPRKHARQKQMQVNQSLKRQKFEAVPGWFGERRRRRRVDCSCWASFRTKSGHIKSWNIHDADRLNRLPPPVIKVDYAIPAEFEWQWIIYKRKQPLLQVKSGMDWKRSSNVEVEMYVKHGIII